MFQPWPDSVLSLDSVSFSAPAANGAEGAVVWFCAVLLFVALLLFNRITTAITGVSAMFGGEVRMNETLRSNFKRSSMTITYILLIPCYALFFFMSGLSEHGIWKIFAIVSGFFAFRYLVMVGIRLVNGRSDATEKVEMLGFAAFIIIGILFLATLVVMHFFPAVPEKIFNIYYIVVAGGVLPIYLLRERKFFLDSRFSHFFWFLYLCAFEILPICVVVKALVS